MSSFSSDESARLGMHDNKDVEGDMADTFAGKGVKRINLENNENENLHAYKLYIIVFINWNACGSVCDL